ncbi:chloroplast heat shock protein 70-1 [Perilla frutescens var. hirtella]|uniref:Chloroplast heat shock protein 70-1 n=1 Tax=Perilla frutescens var. hirtella TaxID=608512 RepID=A0AAD4IQC0_PERFH|nr:chloroplast heat shock protein 70-1 [Perilla frutescens var. hirtella]
MSKNLEITIVGIQSHLSSDVADDTLLKELQESQERMYQTLQIEILKRDVAEIYTVEDSILVDPPSRFGFGSEIKENDKDDDDDLDNIGLIVEDAGKPTIVTNAEGQQATPSVVTQTKNVDRLVGQIAKKRTIINHENTFFSVKRFIGKKMSEDDDESKLVSYNVVREKNGNVKLECPAIEKQFAIEEIPAQVLRKLADDASKFLNDMFTREVVTVPTYFNDYQMTTIKDAGHIACLEVLCIINEPTVASLVYGFKKKSNKTILVVDLGSDNFDVSLLEVGDGMYEVLLTSGPIHLGGDDLDKRIVDWLATSLKNDEGIDLLKEKQNFQNGPKHIETTLTRAKFEKLCSYLFDKLKNPLQNSLMDANLSSSNLNEVILVGGSACIPAVQQFVKKLTGNDPNVTVNPNEVVALGAIVVQVWFLVRDVSDIVLLDVTPLAFGLETLRGMMTKIILRSNTTLPTLKLEVFSTVVDGQTNVEISVLQGEREFVRDNKYVRSFLFDGIPPVSCVVPQIEVKFDIDAIEILSIIAIDL